MAARGSGHGRADGRRRSEQFCGRRQQRVEGVVGAGVAALEGVLAFEGVVGAADATAEGALAAQGVVGGAGVVRGARTAAEGVLAFGGAGAAADGVLA